MRVGCRPRPPPHMARHIRSQIWEGKGKLIKNTMGWRWAHAGAACSIQMETNRCRQMVSNKLTLEAWPRAGPFSGQKDHGQTRNPFFLSITAQAMQTRLSGHTSAGGADPMTRRRAARDRASTEASETPKLKGQLAASHARHTKPGASLIHASRLVSSLCHWPIDPTATSPRFPFPRVVARRSISN